MDPRRLLPPLLVLTTVVVVLTLAAAGWRQWHEGPGPDRGETVAAAARSGPAAVLAAWDERRARAWARGDVRSLRRLYAQGSRAGAADVRLLRRYAARGLRVTGLQTQVLGLVVLDQRPDRLDLLVTDRLVGGVAVGPGIQVPLPRDRPSRRRVVLVRVDGKWLVSRVEDRPDGAQPSAAASTSRTSSSSKS